MEARVSPADVATWPTEKKDMTAQGNEPVKTLTSEPMMEPSPGTLEGNLFEIKIVKNDTDDKLGMDVKHTGGKLQVVRIFEDGAVNRANKKLAASGKSLRVGDLIHTIMASTMTAKW